MGNTAGLRAAALATGGDDTVRHNVLHIVRDRPGPARSTGWVLWNDLLRERVSGEGELRAVRDAQAAHYREATTVGDAKLALTSAGEAVSLVCAIEPAADISERMVARAEAMLKPGAPLVP
jgi:hypothetical protein